MSRKVFSTFFTLILLIVIAVPGLDAWPGVEVVDESAKISASASTLNHAPTGNILKKYRREGGQWVYVRTVEAEWFCRVRMQVKFTGYGNASIGASGQTVKRATGSTFQTLSPDASTTRISSYLFFDRSDPLELFASATGTVKTDKESEIGGYKVTGNGYYEIGHGGDGIGLSISGHGVSATIGGIDSETMSMPLDERNQPHFDIGIQCDPAEACSGNSSPPPTGSTPPTGSGSGGGSQPPSGSQPPPPPTDNTPNCQDCTSDCSSPCSCTNSGTCNGTVVDNTPNCSGCTSDCSSPCSCSDSGTCGGTVSTPPPPPQPTTVACGVGHPYNPNDPQAVHDHTTPFTCRRPGCGVTFTRCSNSTCTSNWGTFPYHWAR